ncbi:hypothetical protein [Candidatus Poriferisocius sp.]|uniref:hypothetical protein n=1 Tax=Candidatus Poriferisocius sp. TaxID=3101276 RepID=UPI003B02D800
MDVTTTVMLSVYGASIVSILGFYLRRIEHRLDSLEAILNRSMERTDDSLRNHGERISTLEGRTLD